MRRYQALPLAVLAAAVVTLLAVAAVVGGRPRVVVRGGFAARIAVTPEDVGAGDVARITATVRSDAHALALVDVEIYGPGGKVFQHWFPDERLRGGETVEYRVTWDVPAPATPGRYAVAIGVFSPDWRRVYLWDRRAAVIVVRDAAQRGQGASATASSSAASRSPRQPANAASTATARSKRGSSRPGRRQRLRWTRSAGVHPSQSASDRLSMRRRTPNAVSAPAMNHGSDWSGCAVRDGGSIVVMASELPGGLAAAAVGAVRHRAAYMSTRRAAES